MSNQVDPGRETAASAPAARPSSHSRFPGFLFRRLQLCNRRLRAGEHLPVALFFSYAFLLLVCYYILKTLREPLLLDGGSAELKSYANAMVAFVLLILIPFYSAAYRRTVSKEHLVRRVTLFFVSNLCVFLVAGSLGADIGFFYYVWVGVFGITILAQFWGFAADSFDVGSGRRLFPAIATGAALGGLIGPALVGTLFDVLGPWQLLAIATVVLAITLPLIGAARRAVSPRIRAPSCDTAAAARTPRIDRLLGGLRLVLQDRYLLLLAFFVALLNCVNSVGEYLLAGFVVQTASEQAALDPTLSRNELVASFYGSYYFVVNLLTLVSQALLVGRVFRRVGVSGAMLVLPLVAVVGYGLIFLIPLFSVIRVIKAIENSADYSIANTSRHAVYLPLPASAKYEGKVAVDTLFCRLGDFLQAGVVFAGVTWLGFGFQQFALLNVLFATIWLAVAVRLARRYVERTGESTRIPQFRLSLAAVRERIARVAQPAFELYRNTATLLLTAALTILALTLPAPAEAEPIGDSIATQRLRAARLFDSHGVLVLEAHLSFKALCRYPNRRRCEDVPATFVYVDEDGREKRVEATIRSRGRYRRETGNCRFPALFVFFGDDVDGTLFEGETMLPLTTHCQHFHSRYEQYVLKEYVAYRLYNLLTDKSLRTRLAHVTYHDTSGKRGPMTRYAFFVEHFDSLARRHDAIVYEPERLDLRDTDPDELAIHDVFQYMIGNTDFSVVFGHNILRIRSSSGLVTVVPYDFDFSGLVDAKYAGPPPNLPISNVRTRLFRGFCSDGVVWEDVVARLHRITADLSGLAPAGYDHTDPGWLEAYDYVARLRLEPEHARALISELQSTCRSWLGLTEDEEHN